MFMRFVGLVRNVMIGREGLHRAVLLERVERCGGRDAVSYITTGNVAFDLEPATLARFRDQLEEEIARVIGRHEPVFVRSLAHLEEMVEAQWFADAGDEVVDCAVSFAREPVTLSVDLPWRSRRGDVEVFAVDGREVFAVGRMVDGRTTGPGGYAERLAGQRVTTRGWSTIERVVRKERARRSG